MKTLPTGPGDNGRSSGLRTGKAKNGQKTLKGHRNQEGVEEGSGPRCEAL